MVKRDDFDEGDDLVITSDLEGTGPGGAYESDQEGKTGRFPVMLFIGVLAFVVLLVRSCG